MKKSYEQMNQIELAAAARKQGVSVPPTLAGLNAVAKPTVGEQQARADLISALNAVSKNRATNWARLGTLIGLAGLIVAAITFAWGK